MFHDAIPPIIRRNTTNFPSDSPPDCRLPLKINSNRHTEIACRVCTVHCHTQLDIPFFTTHSIIGHDITTHKNALLHTLIAYGNVTRKCTTATPADWISHGDINRRSVTRLSRSKTPLSQKNITTRTKSQSHTHTNHQPPNPPNTLRTHENWTRPSPNHSAPHGHLNPKFQKRYPTHHEWKMSLRNS